MAGAAGVLNGLALSFAENRGQAPDEVEYYAHAPGRAICFGVGQLTFGFTAAEPRRGAAAGRCTVRLTFPGSRVGARPEGEDNAGGVVSYFSGPREQWLTAPTCSRVTYRELWPRIDLLYTGAARGRLKSDFVVRPGGDPGRIRLAYDGAASVRLTADGALEIATPAGGMREEKPFAYQDIAGERREVPSHYVLEKGPNGPALVSFAIGEYDRAHPLVIDPVAIIHCGYVGGAGTESANGVAVDPSGNIYIAGATFGGAGFPTAVGPDLTFGGGSDVFVAKIDPTGVNLLYCGYIGGTGNEFGLAGPAIAVDASGNAYVAGGTDSSQPSFPVTVGPDVTHNGSLDAFVARVNPAGTALDYCGYIGGSLGESAVDVAVDGFGNAYVTGSTFSTQATFPVTIGPDLTYNGGVFDVFVAKVSAAGTGLEYCGYIGGDRDEQGQAIALDGAGRAYIAGSTTSTEATFPVQTGPDLTWNSGTDGFVARVGASGTGLEYCGYIGGGEEDYAFGIAVDSIGAAYTAGFTNSDDGLFPVLAGPDLTHNGDIDAFVAKVNPTGTALGYCGFIGGSALDQAFGVGVSADGRAVIAGRTTSDEGTLPVTSGPDLTFNGGTDAFAAGVTASGTGLSFCGYLGGNSDESALDVLVAPGGGIFVIGEAASFEATFPVVGGPDLTQNGLYDGFLARLTEPPVAGGILKVAKSVNFAAVKLGSARQKRLLIRNNDRAKPLQVTINPVAAPFSIVEGGGSVAIPPKGSHGVLLRFAPTAAGRANGSLLLNTSDPGHSAFNVKLIGTGKGRPGG